MKPLLPALALVPVLMLALPALAQTQVQRAHVYRCGPEGRDLRDSPCPGTQADSSSTVDYDQPSSADSRATRAHHLADAKRAAALAQSRRASEAEARKQRSAHIGLQTVAPVGQAASSPPVVALKPPKVAKPRKVAAGASSPR